MPRSRPPAPPPQQVPYAIAWIVPNFAAFIAAHRILQPECGNALWEDEAPVDPARPAGYMYTYKDLQNHHVFLANALDAAHIPHCAEVVDKALKKENFQVQMFLVSALDTFETCPNGSLLNINHCVVDCYKIERRSRSVRQESVRNAKRLLTAVAGVIESQVTDSNCLHRIWPAYQVQYTESAFETYLCRGPGFRDQPCLRFTGLCHQFNMTAEAVDYAYEVAAVHIWEVVHLLPPLEATERKGRY